MILLRNMYLGFSAYKFLIYIYYTYQNRTIRTNTRGSNMLVLFVGEKTYFDLKTTGEKLK